MVPLSPGSHLAADCRALSASVGGLIVGLFAARAPQTPLGTREHGLRGGHGQEEPSPCWCLKLCVL